MSISASPAGAVTQPEARDICKRLAAEILPKQPPNEYRLVWPRRTGERERDSATNHQAVTTSVRTGTTFMPDFWYGRGSGWAKPFRSTVRARNS